MAIAIAADHTSSQLGLPSCERVQEAEEYIE